MPRPALLLLAALLAVPCVFLTARSAVAQDAKQEIEKYQKMIADSSPVELFELQGEAAWKKRQGPKNVSLEQCDLGLGAGVLKGAYAQLPRYFRDADRVMDLETRLLHCMTTQQGRSREEATKRLFGNEDAPSEMEYLSAYVAAQSRGAAMAPGASHAKERESYELGRKLFFYRAGPWDFSCASCHGETGKRIRMQDLPVLSTPAAARPVVATWPAYRVSNSQFKTMQWRINDCYRQMRMPEPNYASDLTVAITTYLTVTGKGEPYRGPGTKR
jgi:sulfur-oxidizing protein SoxA